eukprot:gene10102-13578_t
MYKRNDFNLSQYELTANPCNERTIWFDRIISALSLLRGTSLYNGPPVEWIVYIDADAFIAEDKLPMSVLVEAGIKYANSFDDKKECSFIGQDYPHIINSGFWLLRNNTWSIKFVEQWIEELYKSVKYDKCWQVDQGPLQSVVAGIAAYEKQAIYDDLCWKLDTKSDHIMNLCYETFMNKLNLKFDQRETNHICLFPQTNGLIPYSHAVHNSCAKGMLVCHKKGLTEEIIHSTINSSCLDYNPKNHSIMKISNSLECEMCKLVP